MSSQDPTQVDPQSYGQHPSYQPPQQPPYEPGPMPGQQHQQPYGGPPAYGHSPGAASQVSELARNVKLPRTSEFIVWLIASVAILIAGIIAGPLDAEAAWTLVAVVSSAYIVSRGIAKAGARPGAERSPDHQI